MPFNPKLIRADDPPHSADGELKLPGDLAALAEPLGDDARHLATKYPAAAALAPCNRRVGGEGSISPLALGGRGIGGEGAARLAKAAILVGVSLATLLVAFVVVQQLGNEENSAPRTTKTPAIASMDSSPRQPLKTASPAAGISLPGSSGGTISLTELSGPELEAAFDLWRRGEGSQPSSIAF